MHIKKKRSKNTISIGLSVIITLSSNFVLSNYTSDVNIVESVSNIYITTIESNVYSTYHNGEWIITPNCNADSCNSTDDEENIMQHMIIVSTCKNGQ